ncbi:MAG TPA: metallophosphoesterase family protein [Trebonia sp.]
MSDDRGAGSPRRPMTAAGTTSLVAAATASPERAGGRGQAGAGTPEQVRLTWGDDPARTVDVFWASAGQAGRPRVRIGQRVIAAAAARFRDDPRGGAATWTYHARVDGLRPGATYGYAVTADNDANAADPFSATFTTAPTGRAAFRFTSFGDLAAPEPPGGAPFGEAAYAVGAVEAFQPLFHLFNADLSCAGRHPAALGPTVRAQAWRDFGNNVQASAAYRPWLPVPGRRPPGPGEADGGPASLLTRDPLPRDGVDGPEGRWYAFRVGTALFVCLSGDDVACAGAGAFSGGAQTRWLDGTLAAARADASVDWIVVQVHPCACSSAGAGYGSDRGLRHDWLPLFDRYEVDLVLSGHDRGYERSFPVRGFDAWAGTDTATGTPVDTSRPHPVTRVDSGVFDTSQGTVHLALGSGGGAAGGSGPDPAAAAAGGFPAGLRTAAVFTRPPGPFRPVAGDGVPGGSPRPAADATETATWSARRDSTAGYGIAVFDVSPGTEKGGQTSVTVRYYHAVGAGPVNPATGEPGPPGGDYTLFETFTLVRPRSDGRRWHLKG